MFKWINVCKKIIDPQGLYRSSLIKTYTLWVSMDEWLELLTKNYLFLTAVILNPARDIDPFM